MTFDHRTTEIHRADLDREIEMIRTERAIARTAQPGSLERVRVGAGRALIAAGEALAGGEGRLRAHRA